MKTIKEGIPALFGDRKLTLQELWALVKILRVVRMRCRNNVALNNQLNSAFPYARFTTVTKERPSRYNPSVKEKYLGLQITVEGQTAEGGDDDEENS